MSRFNHTFITAVILADILAVIYFGGSFILTGSILPHGEHAEKSYIVAETSTEKHEAVRKEEVKVAIIPDPAKGAKVSGKCKACHTFEAGGSNRIGPALWGIVGKKAGTADGFKYSGSMADSGITWNAESLDAFLKSPKKYMAGTKMAFAGLRKEEDRVHLISWLETLK